MSRRTLRRNTNPGIQKNVHHLPKLLQSGGRPMLMEYLQNQQSNYHISNLFNKPYPSSYSELNQEFDLNYQFNQPNNLANILQFNTEPQPLIPQETINSLRQKLRMTTNQSDVDDLNYMEPYNPENSHNQIKENDYLQEKQDTKQKIEEIIMVAQALREKLEHDEKMRKLSEYIEPVCVELNDGDDDDEDSYEDQNYITLQNSTLKDDRVSNIPSLFDIYVPPPIVSKALHIKTSKYDPQVTCWNCNKVGHKFPDCRKPKSRKFCFRCGEPNTNITSCPKCKSD